ncbi:MAG: tyrosine-type recombinase/integrase [Pirellulales bacterium]
MPRRANSVPSYRLHKASGQARVLVDGRHLYLGIYGSEVSRQRYARLIAKQTAASETTPSSPQSLVATPDHELTVAALVLRYWEFAKTYYIKDGEPTKELVSMREALRPVRRLFGDTLAEQFGPKALKLVREQMINQGLSRKVINQRVNRIKRAFKWAVAEELVPPSVLHGLQAVTGLRFGRTSARETQPIRPAVEASVEAVLTFVAPQVAAMIQLQRCTGMRPNEVVAMRPCDIDRSGDVWNYEPARHKNQWRGHVRRIPLGPRAQTILTPFLDRPQQAYLFSPAEAEDYRQEQRRRARKSPMTPSQSARCPRVNPKRAKRAAYDVDSYRRAISYGIAKARRAGLAVEHWHPLQLRHLHATRVREKYGLEGAQVALGHARADVTQVYAERNLALARRIAVQLG